jgi:hypothetical protein
MWGFVIQVLSVDGEPLSGVSPAGFASPSTRARRQYPVHPADEYVSRINLAYTLGIVSDWGLDIVSEPDKSHAVIVHAREECPPVRLPEYVFIQISNH